MIDPYAVLEWYPSHYLGKAREPSYSLQRGLSHVTQLEYRVQRSLAGQAALGSAGSMAQGADGRYDPIGGANAAPVLGGEFVKRHHRLSILEQTSDGIRELGLGGIYEGVERATRVMSGLRLLDVTKRLLRIKLGTLRRSVQHIAHLVHSVAVMSGSGPQFLDRESHGCIADGQL